MLDTLLIQLFGREVTDRLTRAGFDSTEAIARTNAGELADEAGIAPALARRIIAVAAESGQLVDTEQSPEPASDDQDSPPAASPQPAERHVRRPFKRPTSNLTVQVDPPEAATPTATPAATSAPPAESSPQAAAPPTLAPPPATAKSAAEPPPEMKLKAPTTPPPPGTGTTLNASLGSGQRGSLQSPMDGVALIDDSGLISSLGAAYGAGHPSRLSISVAEEILDAPSPEKPAPESKRPADPTPDAVEPGQPIIEGSFWTFGQWQPAPTDRADEPTRQEETRRTGRATPRRRSVDDH